MDNERGSIAIPLARSAERENNAVTKEIKYTLLLVLPVIATLLFRTIVSFYYMFAPMSWWIEYYDVSPAKNEFKVNEQLKFISNLALYKQANLEFNDVLFCREPLTGDLVRYSEQNTKRFNSTPYDKRYTTWPYSPGVSRETECYLESNILLKLPLDFDKTVRVIGGPFNVVAEE